MHGTTQLQTKQPSYDAEAIRAIERLAQIEASETFWAFRRYLNPKMLLGWWQRQVARELNLFWLQYKAGRRPKLLLQSPPQHGKSMMIVDFLAWIVGQDPSTKIIFGSYSDHLGTRANLRLQRIFAGERYQGVFGSGLLAPDYRQNSRIIEFAKGEGYFRNTTVGGPITGETLDIGVVDDPIKGRAEASSKIVRDKTWLWFTDDFLSRFSEKGAMVMIMTRYHLDDPAGRMIEAYPGVRCLRYPALAESDMAERKEGEPLFPKLKSLDYLMKQKAVMTQASWESIYQQNPIAVGGDLFPIDKFVTVAEVPKSGLRAAARYWDKAGTSGGGAHTAGSLVLSLSDGTFCVADMKRGQWSAMERERVIKQTADVDEKTFGIPIGIYVEQEPGSGGKESAENTIRMLAGHRVEADRVTGSKEIRAEPYAAQVQAGNVKVVAADWTRDFLDEHEQFPVGKFKDQVDATAGAFNKLTLTGSTYDITMSWVR